MQLSCPMVYAWGFCMFLFVCIVLSSTTKTPNILEAEKGIDFQVFLIF